MPKVLYDNTCFNFPAYNNNIPDIARADWFREDIADYRKKHQGKLPHFINIAICNDHGAGKRPERGYPYTGSFMADNDLALGRIVEFLSHQPEWKKMAIFVTQDDSGGDGDHIDRHRSFVLCISPWAKKHYVAHQHTSIMSIIKTIYRLFNLGPNNLCDALATDLSEMFTTTPDLPPTSTPLPIHVSLSPPTHLIHRTRSLSAAGARNQMCRSTTRSLLTLCGNDREYFFANIAPALVKVIR